LPFNTICGEYSSPAGGWVHAVAFSPSGDLLAFASEPLLHFSALKFANISPPGHDSSVNVVYPLGGVINVRMSTLPLVTLTWISEDTIVAAGHDCQPLVFSGSEQGWRAVGSLDDTSAPKSSSSPRSGFGSPTVGRLDSAAFRTFRNADSRGVSGPTSSSVSTSSELLTVHQNTINSVRPFESAGGRVSRVSTSGVDGKLVVWDTKSVSSGASALTGRLGSLHLR
jgi:actin related protein 2/3 complex subunit 1A/1B